MVALQHKTRRQPAPSSHLLKPESPAQDALANGIMCGWKTRNAITSLLPRTVIGRMDETKRHLLYGTDEYDGPASAQRDDTYDERGGLDLRVPESAAEYSFEGEAVWGKKILAFWMEPPSDLRPSVTDILAGLTPEVKEEIRIVMGPGPVREAVLVWDRSDIMDCGVIQGPGQEILPPELYRKLVD